MHAITRRKTIAHVLAEVEDSEGHGAHGGGLKKCLTRWDVVAYGVSSTVGAGIFVITGERACLGWDGLGKALLLPWWCG